MKKLILTSAVLLLSFSALASNPPKLWNNKGITQTFKKGDTVKIKAGSKSSAYVVTGKVQHVCNAKYIKVNGYFVAIADIDVIIKYYNVK
jgi:hypothetical protein